MTILAPGQLPETPAGWKLEDYEWHERDGVAVMRYALGDNEEEETDPAKLHTILAEQPSRTDHASWADKVPIDYEAVKARYFEAEILRMQMEGRCER